MKTELEGVESHQGEPDDVGPTGTAPVVDARWVTCVRCGRYRYDRATLLAEGMRPDDVNRVLSGELMPPVCPSCFSRGAPPSGQPWRAGPDFACSLCKRAVQTSVNVPRAGQSELAFRKFLEVDLLNGARWELHQRVLRVVCEACRETPAAGVVP